MKLSPRQFVLSALALGVAPLADAHPLAAHGGVVASFLHPFSGFDHVLAMVVVGLWAGRARPGARRWPPLAFMLGLVGGALLGMGGMAWSGYELAVATSLLLLGPLAARALRVPAAATLALCALAGLAHGQAHGVELAHLGVAALAFVAGSAALHGLGFGLARLAARRGVGGALRLALDLSALAGLWMLGAA